MGLFLYSSRDAGVSEREIKKLLKTAITPYGTIKKALILPPDITRGNSYAGQIVCALYAMLSPSAKIDIMPALGTHMPMSEDELDRMYPGIPHECFFAHDWRGGVAQLGSVPAEFVSRVSDGLMDEPIDIEVNKRLLDRSYDIILSVGQVVPHEVVGMANYSKNIFVGCGGGNMLNKTHYLGALYGMERMMGRDRTPVRRIFDYAEKFLNKLPLLYILTVTSKPEGRPLKVEGVFVGKDREPFEKAVALSREKNFCYVERPLKKVVCYLDPEEFKTTWLGNKSVYRTRMAIADGGELIVIAPGVFRFGEDRENDRLIRKYGYKGTQAVKEAVASPEGADIRANLSVAAHLIHGSSEGRFKITYAPGRLTKKEVESVGYEYMPYKKAIEKYDPCALNDGFNTVDGEEIFFISNPALGLWAEKGRFEAENEHINREETP